MPVLARCDPTCDSLVPVVAAGSRGGGLVAGLLGFGLLLLRLLSVDQPDEVQVGAL